jgi:basic membrane protein A
MVSRRDVLKASGVGLTVGLAGCSGGRGTPEETTDNGDGGGGGGGGGGGSDTPTGTETESQTPLPGEDVNVGVIYARGGLGDQSFSDAANRGVRRAREELGISFTNAEPQSTSDFNSFQRRFAESTDPDYDLIVCVGFEHVAPLQENANTYSDQQWAQLDAVVDRSNVESWVYAEEQGSYLVGQAAAQLSTMEFSAGPSATDPSNTVLGFVGGIEAPVVQAFEAGFRAGAKSVDSGFDVRASYVGDFSSPGVAEETAQSMIDEGADVLYHGAGAGGVGVFRAAQNNEVFAFGADSRQSETVPDFANVILGSMIKGVDTSAFRAVEHVVNDDFQGGNVFELGAGEGGFELVWSDSVGTDVPQEVKDAVVATKEELAAGNIDVPATPS